MSSPPLAHGRVGFGSGRLLVAPSILGLAIASGAAVYAWPAWRDPIHLCYERVLGAAHINWAVGLAFLCGLVVPGLLLALRSHPRGVGVTLLVSAAVLGICITLVGYGSGTYSIYWPPGKNPGDMVNCYRAQPLTDVYSVRYLYPWWGGAVALLLVQAVRAFRHAPPASEGPASEAT